MADTKITPDAGNIEIKHGEGELPRAPLPDLFGDYAPPRAAKTPGKRREPTPWGYYAPPGVGPPGQTCKTCANCVRVRLASKVVHKCRKAEAKWTHSRKTDILVRTPACIGWEQA